MQDFTKLLESQGLKPQDWLPLTDAARQRGLTPIAARRATYAGWFQTLNLNGRLFVRPETLDRYVQHLKSPKAGNPKRPGTQQSDCQNAHSPNQPLATHHSPLTTHHLPLTTHPINHSPLTTHQGLQIDGRIWIDHDADDVWIPVDHANRALCITTASVHALARKGKLRRRWADKRTGQPIDEKDLRRTPRRHTPIARAMYSLREIDALSEKRANEGRHRTVPDYPEKPNKCVHIRTKLEAPPGDQLISVAEAAGILAVSRPRVSSLVAGGRLFGWQKEPGKRGSRLYLSANQVWRYAHKPERLQDRQEWNRTQTPGKSSTPSTKSTTSTPRKLTSFQEEHHFWDAPGKALEKDHKDYYTTWQAARYLNVTRKVVRSLRTRGILIGHRSPTNKQVYSRNRWWFFKKEDVHELKSNFTRQRQSRAYWKSKMSWAYGDEANQESYNQPKEPEYRPHQWNPKQPTDRNPFEELREGMRIW